jgi:hypothetical protein
VYTFLVDFLRLFLLWKNIMSKKELVSMQSLFSISNLLTVIFDDITKRFFACNWKLKKIGPKFKIFSNDREYVWNETRRNFRNNGWKIKSSWDFFIMTKFVHKVVEYQISKFLMSKIFYMKFNRNNMFCGYLCEKLNCII